MVWPILVDSWQISVDEDTQYEQEEQVQYSM